MISRDWIYRLLIYRLLKGNLPQTVQQVCVAIWEWVVLWYDLDETILTLGGGFIVPVRRHILFYGCICCLV